MSRNNAGTPSSWIPLISIIACYSASVFTLQSFFLTAVKGEGVITVIGLALMSLAIILSQIGVSYEVADAVHAGNDESANFLKNVRYTLIAISTCTTFMAITSGMNQGITEGVKNSDRYVELTDEYGANNRSMQVIEGKRVDASQEDSDEYDKQINYLRKENRRISDEKKELMDSGEGTSFGGIFRKFSWLTYSMIFIASLMLDLVPNAIFQARRANRLSINERNMAFA